MSKGIACVLIIIGWCIPTLGDVGDQLAKLIATDPAAGDEFGISTAISGNIAIVGAYRDDDGGYESGSAYLFDVTTGSQIAKLTANDAAPYERFGYSVAINGNTAIVGAPADYDVDDCPSGSAYLFDVSTGNQTAKLTAGSTAADGDRFGKSVAISASAAIVGAPGRYFYTSHSGSAYLFDVTTGSQLARLTATDAAEGDEFGISVAISGKTAIVGAHFDDDGGGNVGSAYVFDATTGGQLAKLTATGAMTGDYFGHSVGLSEDTAIVGAWGAGDTMGSWGLAYLFDVTTGSQLATLTATDVAEQDHFGYSVGISGKAAIVGAHGNDDVPYSSGSAYLFDVTTGSQLAKLTADDAAQYDVFGSSVAISGNTAIVGAHHDDHSWLGSAGSAYLFEVPEPGTLCLLAVGGLALLRRKRGYGG